MSSRPADPALLLAAIVDSSADAIVSKDLDGVITSWNRGAERLFGYSADEAVGRPVTMLIPDERLSEEDVVLVLIRKGERVEPFDTVRRRKDDTLVDVSVTVSPVRASDGTIVGASKIARDISYRKRVDEELGELKDRLLALAGASASILGSPDIATVLSGTIELARRVIASDAYALWRLDPASGWRMLRAFGVSEEFSRPIAGSSVLETSGHAVAFSEPLVIEDVEHEPALAGRRDAYRREGVVSMVVFPLSIRGERTATLVFYSRLRRRYRDIDIQVGTALANIAAASLTTAELYAEQRARREAADQARQRAAFLAEAGTALSASLDYERTLKVVAGLAVPLIADWCAVDIVDDDGASTAARRRARRSGEGRARPPARAAVPGGPEGSGRGARGAADRPAVLRSAHRSRRARPRGTRRRTPPHPARPAAHLVHVRAAAGPGQDARHDHVRQRRVRTRVHRE